MSYLIVKAAGPFDLPPILLIAMTIRNCGELYEIERLKQKVYSHFIRPIYERYWKDRQIKVRRKHTLAVDMATLV